jgi:hypothetical protein
MHEFFFALPQVLFPNLLSVITHIFYLLGVGHWKIVHFDSITFHRIVCEIEWPSIQNVWGSYDSPIYGEFIFYDKKSTLVLK